jgi:hypothetical protein
MAIRVHITTKKRNYKKEKSRDNYLFLVEADQIAQKHHHKSIFFKREAFKMGTLHKRRRLSDHRS